MNHAMQTIQEIPPRKTPRISAAQNDARYIARGEATAMAVDPAWDKELEMMNAGKVGRPYKYADGLIEVIGVSRFVTGTAYRECQGLARKIMGKENAPHYSVICRRLNGLDVKADSGKIDVTNKNRTIRMAVDGTGMIPSTRGEWLRHKWKVKRGFIRLSIMVDADTKKILAFVITEETVGESHQLPSLLDAGLDKLGIPRDPNKRTTQIVIILGDKGYDSRKNFSYCRKLGVKALIPVRVNANCRAGVIGRARTEAVIEQFGDGHTSRDILHMLKDERRENQKKWKKRSTTKKDSIFFGSIRRQNSTKISNLFSDH